MWLAELETTNFFFQALGETEGQAREALAKGLKLHGEEYFLRDGWASGYDINVYQIAIGDCVRDRVPLNVMGR